LKIDSYKIVQKIVIQLIFSKYKFVSLVTYLFPNETLTRAILSFDLKILVASFLKNAKLPVFNLKGKTMIQVDRDFVTGGSYGF
jgi:hypothetical protein